MIFDVYIYHVERGILRLNCIGYSWQVTNMIYMFNIQSYLIISKGRRGRYRMVV